MGDGLEPGSELRASRNDGSVAFRPGGDHSNFNLELIGNKVQVIARGGGQLFHVANSRRRLAPARKRLVVGLDLRQRFDVTGHLADRLTLEAVADADFYFRLRIEDVE